MNNQYETLLEAISELKKKGFEYSFNLRDNDVYCPVQNKNFLPEDLSIVEFHRFEGNSDVDDMSIIYAIEAPDGCKGIIIDAFGTYANTAIGDFLNKVHS